MADHGILYTPEMIQAYDEDRKTQTRRLIKNPERLQGLMLEGEESEWCPHPVGTRLYIKEPHYRYGYWVKTSVLTKDKKRQRRRFVPKKKMYAPDILFPGQAPNLVQPNTDFRPGWYKRSPLFMPKAFARKWSVVTRVRVERARDISDADVRDEGIEFYGGYWHSVTHEVKGTLKCWPTAIMAWEKLIESINGPGTMDKWYWVYDYKKIVKE